MDSWDEHNNLVREHFKRDGFPKVKMESEHAIELAAELDMQAYRCSFCGWWHLGK